MRALLDVNVLIALLDQDHSMHVQALRWFAARAGDGWASCPITQNGCVRIMAHPNYPNPLKVGAIMERLGEAIAQMNTSSGRMTSACWIPASRIATGFTGLVR